MLSPLRDPIVLAPAQPGTTVEAVATYEAAMRWFANEHSVLLGAIRVAAAQGFDEHARQLAWAALNFFDRRGHWHDWNLTQQTAPASAQRAANPYHVASTATAST